MYMFFTNLYKIKWQSTGQHAIQFKVPIIYNI